MKKVNFLLISFAFVGTFLLSSCSKEAKIEKNLWNKGGEWTIEKMTVNQTSSFAPDNYTETIFNVGTLFFKEDGVGTYTFTADGSVDSGVLNYSNTEDKLTLIIDNDARVYTIVSWEKGSMQLYYSETTNSNGISVSYDETLNLKKK